MLIPTENRRSFMEVSAEVLERVAPIFYGDANAAAFKALGGEVESPAIPGAP